MKFELEMINLKREREREPKKRILNFEFLFSNKANNAETPLMCCRTPGQGAKNTLPCHA